MDFKKVYQNRLREIAAEQSETIKGRFIYLVFPQNDNFGYICTDKETLAQIFENNPTGTWEAWFAGSCVEYKIGEDIFLQH